MIDVHVITRRGDRTDWMDQCMASLHHPLVRVHVIDGKGRSIHQNRRAGFWSGTAPYVTFVDPDDWVEPGAWDAVLAAIERAPGRGLYFTDEAICDYTGRRVRLGASAGTQASLTSIMKHHLYAHHLLVMDRRRFVDADAVTRECTPLPEWRWGAHAAVSGGFEHVQVVGYNWRIHAANAHHRIASQAIGAAKCELWGVVG